MTPTPFIVPVSLPKPRKTEKCRFSLLCLLLSFWGLWGRWPPFSCCPVCWGGSHAAILRPQERSPVREGFFCKVPGWRVVGMQWGAIVRGLLVGRIDGNDAFKKQCTKVVSSYSSDLLRPKPQARETIFPQALWFLSDYKSCSIDACLNTSHASSMKGWSSSILPASWSRKHNESSSKRQVLPLPPVTYSLPSHRLLSGKKGYFSR